MAEAGEPQFLSLADRIAALNKSQVGAPQSRQSLASRKPPPPPPPPSSSSGENRPTLESRTKSINNPPIVSHGSSVTRAYGNLPAPAPVPSPSKSLDILPRPASTKQHYAAPTNGPPPLPGRKASQPSPALPPRRSSAQPDIRRGSTDSMASQTSSVSSLSVSRSIASSTTSAASSTDTAVGRKLPPSLDRAKLPPLPPSRREKAERETLENAKRAPLVSTKSSPAVPIASAQTPSLPPRRPTQPKSDHPVEVQGPGTPQNRRLTPFASSRPITGFSNSKSSSTPALSKTPPPVPYHSRPSAADLEALTTSLPSSKPILQQSTAAAADCLHCRDFSAPDSHAARFPRSSLRNGTPAEIAELLCTPFGSPTDKARAIFTWLHQNVAYDVEAFFGNRVRATTPGETIGSGLAVCAGYAGVFAAVAAAAGLEAVVVAGHGKGFRHVAPRPGEPLPRYSAGHAWNAVRIDGGAWKLVDCCWGAGSVGGGDDGRGYTKRFSPICFTEGNEAFGARHFPENAEHFFRADGRRPSWEEYILGRAGAGGAAAEPLTIFGDADEHGIDRTSFVPAAKLIPLRAGGGGAGAAGAGGHGSEVVRFQFSKVCEHWRAETNSPKPGRPKLLLMKVGGEGGRAQDWVPLETDGFWWWLDIERKSLGAPGQKVMVMALCGFDGGDGRGVTREQFLAKKGRVGMGPFGGVAMWELI